MGTGAASLLVWTAVALFVLGAILALVGGVVAGLELSGTDDRTLAQLEAVSSSDYDPLGYGERNEGILFAWITGGVVLAAICLSLAALLVHASRALTGRS